MKPFPTVLRHGRGLTMTLDQTRLLLALTSDHTPEEVEERLREVGLVLEDSGDRNEKAATQPSEQINHSARRYWTRSANGQPIDPDISEALAKLFGDTLDWLGPIYRLPNSRGRVGMLCPLPNVLVVRLSPRPQVKMKEVAASLAASMSLTTGRGLLKEVPEKSKYLGDFRYFEINDPQNNPAYDLRQMLLEQGNDQVVDVRLENMPMVVPTAVIPNDTMFAQQWNMSQIQAPAGWDINTGDSSVVICVLDEGCDLDHPDLQFSDPGINLGTMMPTGAPTGSHGTACAGIAAATFNNATGVAGVAGGCEVLPLAFQSWSDVEVAAGINYAADNGAHVISMSFGSNGWDPTIIDPAIQHAFDTDVVMCVATHNYNGPITYPATNPLVLAVGASDEVDNRKTSGSPDGECWGSDFGPEISVVAPGVRVPTTDIQGSGGYNVNGGSKSGPCVTYASSGDAAGDYYAFFNGTSAATPHVAGLAGLIRSAYPGLNNVQVRAIIERTAEKVGTVAYAETAGYDNGTWNQEMGYGRINVFRALDVADMMIRDYPSDIGLEPSTPPGGVFWAYSDTAVRLFDDNVFVPSDPAQSKHLELGQTNYLYIRVKNNGPSTARNVVVTARLTPYVGTEFVYPHDWTSVDATHLSPTPVTAAFASIPAGGEEMAKFTISAAQVQTLWDENWHPCMTTSVTADNDYAFETAVFVADPIVVRRNNLAQRNLSVINVLADATATFPFLSGHVLNAQRFMEIVVNRRSLPTAMPLTLALDDGNKYFPHVDLDLVTPTHDPEEDDCHRGIVFLDETRIRTKLGCCDGVLTLSKGSRFDCPPQTRVGKVTVKGGEVVLKNGRRYVNIYGDEAVIHMEKAPYQVVALNLQARMSATAKSGEQFTVHVAQRNEQQQTVGGASATFLIA